MFGMGFGPRLRGGAAPLFNPATLNLSGWFRAFGGGTSWAGTASAGTSGSRTLSEATNPATVGATLNGVNTASFNGTTKRMLDTTGGAGMSQYHSTTNFGVGILFNAAAITGGSATTYDNPGLWCTQGGANLSVCIGSATNDSLIIRVFDSSAGQLSTTIALTGPTSAWNFAQLRCSSTGPVCEARVNGGSWTALTGGTFTSVSGFGSDAGLGINWDQTKFLSGLVSELFTWNILETQANFDNIRSYLNGTYLISV